jgi:inner membrane protein
LTHGLLGAVVICGISTCIARRRLRVLFLSLLTFHLHLLCDYVGSRGPEVNDKWPIFYLAPFRLRPMWVCPWQWRLDGWQNLVISLVLFIWAISMALKRGDSFISVFSRKADAIFVATLTRWRDSFRTSRPQ